MERLTRRDEHGNVVKVKSSRETYICTILEDEAKFDAEILNRLAEYEDAEEAGLIKRLPCKEGTSIYCIKKDCERNCGRMEEFKPTKEFDTNCVHYHPDFYECEEYCDCQDDYEHYCSLNLEIYCELCKERLTIHKDYFSLSKITQIYGTAQFNPNTKLEDTYFLTVEEAQKKIEELKNE